MRNKMGPELPTDIAFEICTFISNETLFAVWWGNEGARKRLLAMLAKMWTPKRIRVFHAMITHPNFSELIDSFFSNKEQWRQTHDLTSVLRIALSNDDTEALSILLKLYPNILRQHNYLPETITLQSAKWLVEVRAPIQTNDVFTIISEPTGPKISLETLRVLAPFITTFINAESLKQVHNIEYLSFFFTEGKKYVNFHPHGAFRFCLDQLPYDVVKLWIERSPLHYDRFYYTHLADTCSDTAFLTYLANSSVEFTYSENAIRNGLYDENFEVLEWWADFYDRTSTVWQPFLFISSEDTSPAVLDWAEEHGILTNRV